jgi:hypothetical protein
MENKTAMQRMLEWVRKTFPMDLDTPRMIEDKIESLLKIEKEQIIDAYSYGFWRGNNDDDFEPDEYYKNPYCNPDNKYYGK